MSVVGRVFVDTNVLVYAWDGRDLAKREAAQRWLGALFASGRGRLSWQVLNEFQWVASKKLNASRWEIREFVETLALWGPVDTTMPLVKIAWELMDQVGLSYWDALIVAAALRLDSQWLLSEDMQTGRKFDRLTVVNPFTSSPDDFELARAS